LRQNQGDDTEILSAATFQERTIKAIDETLRNGGFLSLLFHPFLTNTPERFEAMQSILEHLVSLRKDVWVTTMREAAEWILENKETFPEDPEWDTAEWKKK
jgi:ribosomal protein L17